MPEALARMARALVVSGSKFIVIIDDPQHIDSDEVEHRVGNPLRAVLRRGMTEGTLRQDLPVEVLARFWGGLLVSTIRSMRQFGLGVERASAAMSSVFLYGVQLL